MPEFPTPGKTVVSQFVSPDIRDKLVYLDVDSRNGSYAPLAIGTAHPNATNPDTRGRTFTGYLLVYQVPVKDDDTKVRQFYAAPRLNQEEYNFTIEYPHGDTAYPEVVRTYVLPRSTYAAVAPGTADPGAFSATLGLIKQQHGRSDDPKIDTYFVVVRRTYGRLPTPWLAGQEYDPTFDFSSASFTSRFEQAGIGVNDPNTRIETIDTVQQKRTVFAPNTAEINSYFKAFGTRVKLDLPAVLNGISSEMEGGGGDGSFDENGTGAAIGTPAQLSISLRGSGSSSRVVMPVLFPDIDEPLGELQATDYYFFLTSPTTSNILGRLTAELVQTVLAWPSFRPKRHSLKVKGSKVSVAATATGQCMVYMNSSGQSFSLSEGSGDDYDYGLTIQKYDLPPTIHGAITISGTTDAELDAFASASVGTPSGTNWPGFSASGSRSGTASGSVSPLTLDATSPAAIPSSGLYLVDVQHSFYRHGYAAIFARVINAADI